jgi:anti-sigma B factor antagonist
MDLQITQSESGKTRTVRLEGSCDLATAPTLKAALQPLCPPDVDRLIIDMAKLEFIDSTGLGVILGAMRRLREGGGTLEITGATGIVRRVLEITDLDKVIPIIDPEPA